MARTLVTGGAGYIGMMLADELLDAGRDVTALDVFLHDQRAHARTLEERGVRVVEGDIRDADARRRRWRTSTPSSISRRSWATPHARATRSSRTR